MPIKEVTKLRQLLVYCSTTTFDYQNEGGNWEKSIVLQDLLIPAWVEYQSLLSKRLDLLDVLKERRLGINKLPNFYELLLKCHRDTYDQAEDNTPYKSNLFLYRIQEGVNSWEFLTGEEFRDREE